MKLYKTKPATGEPKPDRAPPRPSVDRADADSRIDAALDAVLKASGSALRHYMPGTIEAMRKAMRAVMVAEYTKGVHDGVDVERDRIRRAIG